MNKRGQITWFVIIGIVLIILILLFIFLRDRVIIGPPTQENLENQFPQIKEHVEECLVEIANPRLRQIGLQGGFINTPEDTFRLSRGEKVSYLCWNINDQPYCRSRIRRTSDLQSELNEFIQQDLQSQCLNINAFNKAGYYLSQGQLEIQTTIADDTVLIEANLPITIRRGDLVSTQSDFSILINVPLGRLFNSARDIVEAESTIGNFDTLPYSILKSQLTGKPYIAQRKQPYPDKIYQIIIKDIPTEENPYIFQFFVEGEPR